MQTCAFGLLDPNILLFVKPDDESPQPMASVLHFFCCIRLAYIGIWTRLCKRKNNNCIGNDRRLSNAIWSHKGTVGLTTCKLTTVSLLTEWNRQ